MAYHYSKNDLSITMPCVAPAEAHHNLMKSIIINIKYQMLRQDEYLPPDVKDSNVCLLQLLEDILPGERILQDLRE